MPRKPKENKNKGSDSSHEDRVAELERQHYRDEEALKEIHVSLETHKNESPPRETYRQTTVEYIVTLNGFRSQINKLIGLAIEKAEIHLDPELYGGELHAYEKYTEANQTFGEDVEEVMKIAKKYKQQTQAEGEEIYTKPYPGPTDERVFKWVWNVFTSPFRMIWKLNPFARG